jgi:rod shape determining protein RodA
LDARVFQSLRLAYLPWPILLTALVLASAGVVLVTSATWDEDAFWNMGREARLQALWWGVAVLTAGLVGVVRFTIWRDLAWVGYAGSIAVLLFMLAAANTALVPLIKGQANWIVLGPVRVQPVEFIKIATLVALARFCSSAWFDARRLGHAVMALGVGLLPAALVGKEDLGSALTMVPMVIAVLLLCGMRLRLVALGAALAGIALAVAVVLLPRDGYQWKRIQAWIDPEAYALHEGYQVTRSTRSIGSGQWTGKGFAAGEQNRLGWVPEKHTDMILAVAGEEMGFAGTATLVVLLTGLGVLCLSLSGRLHDPTAQLVAAGFGCLVVGQASINIAVATGLMPVTGVTLPFLSYGGSSLLALHLGLGLLIAARLEHAGERRPGGPRPVWARRG